MNIQQMMKQAQQMQERLQKQMAELRVEATAGGGMVTVVINGAKQLQSIKIDPEVVSKDDVEMLQDLILAAINDAHRKADEAAGAADGRADGRPEDPRHVLMGDPIRSTDSIEQLQRLPGIGAKSAQRLAFHLLKTPREEVDRLGRRDARGEGPRHLLLGLQQHHRRRSRASSAPPGRDHRSSASSRSPRT